MILTLGMLSHTINRRWGGDYWIHQTAVVGFRADLWAPLHPMIGEPVPFSYYSFHAFALAAVGEATGSSTEALFVIVGPLQLILLLVAIRSITVRLTSEPGAATFALVGTLVFWGFQPWRWSGFLNLHSLGLTLPYPSILATATGLFATSRLVDYLEHRRRRHLVAVTALLALTLTTHPFTGAWTLLVLSCVVLSRRDGLSSKHYLLLGASGGLAGAAAVVWPFSDLWHVLTSGGDFAAAHAFLYEAVPSRLFLAIPAIASLLPRFAASRRDPLVLIASVGWAIYACGWIFDQPNLGRVLPMPLLASHLSLAALTASLVQRRQEQRPRRAVQGLAVLSVVGLVGVSPSLALAVPEPWVPDALASRLTDGGIVAPYEPLEGLLHPGDVIVADDNRLRQVAPAFGGYVVAPGYPDPFVDDNAARLAANDRAVRGAPDAAEITTRYGVTVFLCRQRTCRDAAEALGGRVTSQQPDYSVVRLRR
ncbi:MAG: hypothetical protein ABIX10_07400 [Acidimicrobiales bacterium]